MTYSRSAQALRRSMQDTGIGYAGIEGAWWLPAAEPLRLPASTQQQLRRIGQAIFGLFDLVLSWYGQAEGAACGLDYLLEARVPQAIPHLHDPAPVLAVRPDFQLQPDGDGYRLVATELEICPSAQGFAHAMQLGYGLDPDLVGQVAGLLRGRELLIVGCQAWSEFLFEQLAFCKALAAVGAQGRVLYDLPLAELAAQVQAGSRWQPPIFGVEQLPAAWDADLLGRLRRHNLEPYLWPDAASWPQDLGAAVVFRFGYFDCFAPEALARMQEWQARGATFLNPTSFILDSKVLLAALTLPSVRQALAARDPQALAVLDDCIPETRLLEPSLVPQLLAERTDWVVKYAAFDHGNQAWGGRSLQIGAQHTPASWQHQLQAALELPWPVVAQRAVATARLDCAYYDDQNQLQILRNGATRLRCFLMRADGQGEVLVGGAHLTVSGNLHVSEGTAAVQAPVQFGS